MAENNEFSSSQVMTMQQDAIRRVREMQRRANEKLIQTERAMTNSSPSHEEQPQGHTPAEEPQQHYVNRDPFGTMQRNQSHQNHQHNRNQSQQNQPNPQPQPHQQAPVHPPQQPVHQPVQQLPRQESFSPVESVKSVTGSVLSLLDRFGIDHERAMLLLLVFLLLNEGADTKLILALCYLLF